MKRLGRGALELLKVAEELRDAEIELGFFTGPSPGSTTLPTTGPPCSPSSPPWPSPNDRIRGKPLEGQETARKNDKAIGGVKVSDDDMLAAALRLRDQEHLPLHEIASRLMILTGRKRGQHPTPATVMRMLREHE